MPHVLFCYVICITVVSRKVTSMSYVHQWWVRGSWGQSDVSEGGEHLGCPPVVGPGMLLLTDMFDSKFGVSFPPHSDNLLWKFTPLSYTIATTVMSYICCTLYILFIR